MKKINESYKLIVFAALALALVLFGLACRV